MECKEKIFQKLGVSVVCLLLHIFVMRICASPFSGTAFFVKLLQKKACQNRIVGFGVDEMHMILDWGKAGFLSGSFPADWPCPCFYKRHESFSTKLCSLQKAMDKGY